MGDSGMDGKPTPGDDQEPEQRGYPDSGLVQRMRPMWGIPSIWKREKGYEQHDWLFCMIENFGGNVGLHGRMDQLLNISTLPRTIH